MIQIIKTVYSVDEELFRFDTIEEAAQFVWEDAELEIDSKLVVYSGEVAKRKAGDYSTFEVYDLEDRAYDECGEVTEGWLTDIEKEKRLELENGIKELINTWADKHNLQPQFYTVNNIKSITIKFTDSRGSFKIIEE